MIKHEISRVVQEKVFHQCRHIWIPDIQFIRKGYNSVKKCSNCSRSSLTVDSAGLADVGNGHIPYAEDVTVALRGLRKMQDIYETISTIAVHDTYYLCTIKSKTLDKEVFSRGPTLEAAISLAMIEYVTGVRYEHSNT